VECRLTELDFDIAASAGWYSAVAGLLAGFAFVSILFPLDYEREADDDATADAVVVFACAFFSLLIVAIAYAVLAGRSGGSSAAGVAAHEQLLYGWAFGLSALLLLLGLHAILRASTKRTLFAPARRVVIGTIAVIGPLVVLGLQFSNVLDVERYRSRVEPAANCGTWGLPVGVWISLGIVLAGSALVVALALAKEHVPRSPRATVVTAKAVLGATVAIVAWTSIGVPLLPVATVTSAAFEFIALTATVAATTAIAVGAWSSR
jgi:hypothetical protein